MGKRFPLKLSQIVLGKAPHSSVCGQLLCTTKLCCFGTEIFIAGPSGSPIFKMTHSLFLDSEVWVLSAIGFIPNLQ